MLKQLRVGVEHTGVLAALTVRWAQVLQIGTKKSEEQREREEKSRMSASRSRSAYSLCFLWSVPECLNGFLIRIFKRRIQSLFIPCFAKELAKYKGKNMMFSASNTLFIPA